MPSRELFSSSNASKVDDTEKVNFSHESAWFPYPSNWGPAQYPADKRFLQRSINCLFEMKESVS